MKYKAFFVAFLFTFFTTMAVAGSGGCRGDCFGSNHGHPHEHDAQQYDHDHPTDPIVEAHNGWYTGGSLGGSSTDVTTTSIIDNPISACASTNDNDCKDSRRGRTRTETSTDNQDELAFRIFGGKDNIFDLLDGRVLLGAEVGYANLGEFGGVEVDAIDLNATARLPFASTWGVYGRVGAAYWDAEDDGTDLVGALGVSKDIGSLRLGLEYTTYNDVENEDIDVVLLSAAHRF